MQPYFFPYIGYWQLINAVDVFVIYDNIQYTKKGWINRNRFLQNGKDAVFSISLKRDSNFLDVKDRIISGDFNKIKLLNKIKEAYKKAPYFDQVFFLFKKVVLSNDNNLFTYIFFSIKEICKYLTIDTKLIKSSDIDINHGLKSQDKVLAICQNIGTNVYINAIGGKELYSKELFSEQGIDLKFIKTESIIYNQFDKQFVPWLSIIDVMMFNNQEEISKMLHDYQLI